MQQWRLLRLHQKLARAYKLYRSFWVKACNYDRIDPKGLFVVFSRRNPYAPLVGRAWELVNEIRASIYGGQ